MATLIFSFIWEARDMNKNLRKERPCPKYYRKSPKKKHTTVGIRWWSPTQLLIYRFEAYVWQSGRDAQFSSICGRMWLFHFQWTYCNITRVSYRGRTFLMSCSCLPPYLLYLWFEIEYIKSSSDELRATIIRIILIEYWT